MSESKNTITEVSVVNPTTTTDEFVVRYPIFLMFAEYLGYVSPLVDWAEELCKGNDLPTYKKNILRIDARNIFEKMMAECPKEEVHELYEDYYLMIFKDYDEKLIKLEQSNRDDLPF